MDDLNLPVGNQNGSPKDAVVVENATVTLTPPKVMTLAEVEKAHILSVLTIVGGNKVKAAEALGVSVKTIYNKLHEYGLITASEKTAAVPTKNKKTADVLKQLS